MEVGSGTRWCTAGKECQMFDQHTKQGPLYVWIDKHYKLRKGKSKKYQFHFETGQFMDEKDNRIDKELLDYFRLEHPIISPLFRKYEESLKTNPDKIVDYCKNIGRIQSLEQYLVTSQDKYLYANAVIKGRWDNKEIERSLILARDENTAKYLVMLGITLNFDILIDDGVITGEEADTILNLILEGGNIGVQTIYYSRMKQVPELEPYIKNAEPTVILSYIMNSRLSRWVEVEDKLPSIVAYNTGVLMYACKYIGARWLELELEILRTLKSGLHLKYTPFLPFHYANICRNSRWVELEELYGTLESLHRESYSEKYLAKYIKRYVSTYDWTMLKLAYVNPYTSYIYAVYGLKCNWKEAVKLYRLDKDFDFEKIIYSEPMYGIKYISKLVHKRVPEFEKILIEDDYYPEEAVQYVRDIVGSKDAIKELDDVYVTNLYYYTNIHNVPASPEQETIWINTTDIPNELVEYSIKFKKDRWTEFEKSINGSDSSALPYCIHYGRVPEFEEEIKKNYTALDYARLVMFEEWPEAEQYIVDNKTIYESYLRMNIAKYIKCTRRRPWPEVKQTILRYPMEALDYAKTFIEGEWNEANKIIGSDYETRYEYSKHVLKGKLPRDIGPVKDTTKDIEYHWKYLDYVKSLDDRKE
jgi:hypothetical protein